MLNGFKIKTSKKQEILDITEKIKEIAKNSKIKNGICIVFTPHSTTGILTNENYDPNVCFDIINKLNELIPEKNNYKHNCIDNNAHAHIKASLIKPSETIIIKDSELLLGEWQNIGLAEFDGPKTRNIFVKIIEG